MENRIESDRPDRQTVSFPRCQGRRFSVELGRGRFIRQFTAYALVGVVASLLHYAVLVALVEAAHWRAVPATLCGYVAGGIVSYILNRRHIFISERPHEETIWRFVLVAFLGFCLTYVFMRAFVDRFGAPYLPAQLVTTCLVMFMSFFANRAWTFRPNEPT